MTTAAGGGAVVTVFVLTLAGCALPERHALPGTAEPAEKVSLRFCLACAEPREGYYKIADQYGQPLYVAPDAFLDQTDVADATALYGRQRSVIIFEFKLAAAARLERITREHVGQRLAVFVDDEFVVSALIAAPCVDGAVGLDVGLSRQRVAQILRGYEQQPVRSD